MPHPNYDYPILDLLSEPAAKRLAEFLNSPEFSPRPKQTYPPKEELVGFTFGRLTVREYLGSDEHRHSLYRCTCKCGAHTITPRPDLVSNSTTSCGCYRRETAAQSINTWNTQLTSGRIKRVGNRFIKN